jgi:hypothetical protein
MHPILPALAAAAAVGAMWGGLALAEVRTKRRFVALERAFRAYAGDHGLTVVTFAELSGIRSDVGPPMMRGEVQGVEVEVTLQSAPRPLTRVEAVLPGIAGDFALAIQARGGARRPAPRALVEAPTGNKAFDAAFALLSNEPDLARSLLDRRLAQVVLGFPRRFVELSVTDRRFLLAWRGMEDDPAVLDAAIEVAFTACRRRA